MVANQSQGRQFKTRLLQPVALLAFCPAFKLPGFLIPKSLWLCFLDVKLFQYLTLPFLRPTEDISCKGSCVPAGLLQMDFTCAWRYRTPPFLPPSFNLIFLSFFATSSGAGGSYSLPRVRLEDSTLHPESQIIFHTYSEEKIIHHKLKTCITEIQSPQSPALSFSHISTRETRKDIDTGLIVKSTPLLKRRNYWYFCWWGHFCGRIMFKCRWEGFPPPWLLETGLPARMDLFANRECKVSHSQTPSYLNQYVQ